MHNSRSTIMDSAAGGRAKCSWPNQKGRLRRQRVRLTNRETPACTTAYDVLEGNLLAHVHACCVMATTNYRASTSM